jgi:hypothetical protein
MAFPTQIDDQLADLALVAFGRTGTVQTPGKPLGGNAVASPDVAAQDGQQLFGFSTHGNSFPSSGTG